MDLLELHEGVEQSADESGQWAVPYVVPLDLNSSDRGRRGELVAALLIMQAYDAARESSRRRWVSVDFMEGLLPPSAYNTLLQSAPTSYPMDHDDNTPFEARFKDYRMWFNHIIKIE